MIIICNKKLRDIISQEVFGVDELKFPSVVRDLKDYNFKEVRISRHMPDGSEDQGFTVDFYYIGHETMFTRIYVKTQDLIENIIRNSYMNVVDKTYYLMTDITTELPKTMHII